MKMSDPMLNVLYDRAFQAKQQAEICSEGEFHDRERQVNIALNKLLAELIDIRTEQIRKGL